MQQFIDDFIDHNEKIAAFLNTTGQDFKNADKQVASFKNFLIETRYNAALGTVLANFLQCLNQEKHFSDFQLTDIRRLFESLLQLQAGNIDTYMEAAHFEWAVMDDKEKATALIKKGIDYAAAATKKLQQLLDNIENEA
jgi:hypothetical protein